jgi:hypothetical protein
LNSPIGQRHAFPTSNLAMPDFDWEWLPNGEFVGHFFAGGPRLKVAQIMRIGLFAAAYQTWLPLVRGFQPSPSLRCRPPSTTRRQVAGRECVRLRSRGYFVSPVEAVHHRRPRTSPPHSKWRGMPRGSTKPGVARQSALMIGQVEEGRISGSP